MHAPKDPFGKDDCEKEIKLLGEKYSSIYFEETPFNDLAVDEDSYLIIGRRGAGKTALSQYFSFQKSYPNPIYIDVNRPDVYQEVLSEISRRTSDSRPAAVAHLKCVWRFVIWSLIAAALQEERPDLRAVCDIELQKGRLADFVSEAIDRLMSFFSDEHDTFIGPRLERIVNDMQLNCVQDIARQIARKRAIIVALDTLEQYDISNQALMNALAALVEYGSEFNLEYAAQGIHLKIFIAGEVFPHLQEAVLLNPLKVVNHPVYLLWRPRDLLRLIGWRFYRYLEDHDTVRAQPLRNIRWERDEDVMEKIWRPHFGSTLINGGGLKEETWPYVLRHTHLRPRQLIRICNTVANLALREGTFPIFRADQVLLGVAHAEVQLANEIINSYSSVYPNAGLILSSGLQGIQMTFEGRELDRRAKQSAPEWDGNYSPSAFRKLVTEIGVVGRVTRESPTSDYIDADFEYAMTDRLYVTHRDKCVIHPVFYKKLNVEYTGGIVMPFATER